MNWNYYSKFNPKAKAEAIVKGDNYRFTVLTSRLIRVEYSSDGVFEDRKTKLAINRDFPLVDFEVIESEKSLDIVTEHVILTYNKKSFENGGLTIRLREDHSNYHSNWSYGTTPDDLGGTARTLDFVDGETDLEPGLMSKNGYSILDDSKTIILTDDGWYKVKESDSVDIYYFGYGKEYEECLYAYYTLTGFPPLLPRYVFGNWWSRYYEYSQASYMELINRFEKEDLPFTVAVIDMDWHLTEVDSKYGNAWTGYTWDKKLFPDPEGFLTWLKERNYHVTLNVHPAEGVRPFEEMYVEMAKELGVNYEKGEYIYFDVTDRNFMEAYFKYLHHPNEEIGVDFWWVDWQQGDSSTAEGVDPLWVLNHYHFIDANRNGNNIIFSRYAGPGSHRYPIGFSGDTVVTWESLDFQPYFTANSSNIGYTWWSHDIGGHMFGYHDEELLTRWIQFGVFSPINRLHSSKSIFFEKEPWNIDEPYQAIIKDYLRLRHKLIPYLYTMNYLTHTKGLPLIRPMYYNGNGWYDEAFSVPNQYYFGTELIVCPMTTPIDEKSRMSQFKAWLPAGTYYDIFTGSKYQGEGSVILNRPLDKIALLAKAGAIIPVSGDSGNSYLAPSSLDVYIYVGASNEFVLYEDEASTVFKLNENGLDIEVVGDSSVIPKDRTYRLHFKGEDICDLSVNGEVFTGGVVELSLDDFTNGKASIRFSLTGKYSNNNLNLILEYLKKARIETLDKQWIWQFVNKDNTTVQKIFDIMSMDLPSEVTSPVIELLGSG